MLGTVQIRGRAVPTAALLALLVLANAAWVAYFGLRLHGLAIFDEKFAVEGARWLNADIGRLFEMPGFANRGVERLAAVLLLPATATVGATDDQFVVNHLVMALIFALQVIPAYLLARDLGAGAWWGLAAGALAVFGPWAIYGSVFLNNAPAACAAAWALWAMFRAVTRPSPFWDALAMALLALATVARVSSAVLAIAFPVAIAAHVIASRDVRQLRRHWLLGVVGVLGLVWLASGGLDTLVGQYPKSVDTTAGVAGNRLLTTMAHLAAGTAFIGVVVAGAWLVRQLVRPLSPEACTFAALALAYFAGLSYVNLASGIDERYELILFVPLAVAFTVALARQEVALVPAVLLAAVVWLALRRHGDIGWVQPSDYLTWPSRQFLSRVVLTRGEFDVGIGRTTLLHLAGAATVAVAIALALVRGVWRGRLGVAVAAVALVYSFAGGSWAMRKLTNAHRPQATFAGMSFVDQLTGGERADPFGSTAETNAAIPQLWNEVQFFNRSVLHPISLEGDVWDLCCDAAGADQIVAVDHANGTATSTGPLPRYILTVPEWLPAGLASDIKFVSGAYSPPARLEVLRRPPRASWLSTGFDNFGWARPGAKARLRVFPATAPGTPACLRVTLTAPTQVAGGRAQWRIGRERGLLAPAESRRVEIPLRGSDPVTLPVGGRAAGPDPSTGQPGFVGLSDLRVVRCGTPEPPPQLEPRG